METLWRDSDAAIIEAGIEPPVRRRTRHVIVEGASNSGHHADRRRWIAATTVAAHRGPVALPQRAPQSLTPALSNTGPAREIGVADVYPEAARRFERWPEQLDEMGHVPVRERLQSERTAVAAVPRITGNVMPVRARLQPILEDVLVVLLIVRSMAPVRWTCDQEVDASRL